MKLPTSTSICRIYLIAIWSEFSLKRNTGFEEIHLSHLSIFRSLCALNVKVQRGVPKTCINKTFHAMSKKRSARNTFITANFWLLLQKLWASIDSVASGIEAYQLCFLHSIRSINSYVAILLCLPTTGLKANIFKTRSKASKRPSFVATYW